jgi:hypothetical protein
MSEREDARPRPPQPCQFKGCEQPAGDALYPVIFTDQPPAVWLCAVHLAAFEDRDPAVQEAVFAIVHDRY